MTLQKRDPRSQGRNEGPHMKAGRPSANQTTVPRPGQNRVAEARLRAIGLHVDSIDSPRIRLTASHLEDVARVYSAALSAGWAPVQSVALVFGVSHRAAAMRVAVARRNGHLPETTQGVARGCA